MPIYRLTKSGIWWPHKHRVIAAFAGFEKRGRPVYLYRFQDQLRPPCRMDGDQRRGRHLAVD